MKTTTTAPTKADRSSSDYSPLVWGKKTPTQSGYYWYRHHVKAKAVIYDVAASERLCVVGIWDGTTLEGDDFEGWWAGPIQMPTPPRFPLENK